MTTIFAPFVTAAEPFYTVRLSYLTDIITAEDGTEQRVMLRIIPRREESFLARTYQTCRTGWLDSLTYGNQNSQLAVPEWPHGTFLTSAVTAGSSVVLNVITTADTDFAVGGKAVLWTDEGHTEEVTISAKTATSITATTLASNWASGAFVIPSRNAHYSGELSIARLSARVADLPVTVAIEHGTNPGVTSPTSAQIFTTVPYMRVDVSHDLTRQVERLESPTYTFADYQLGDAPIGCRPFKVWLASRASVTSLIAWFHGVRGRFKTFYLPTYQQDLDVLSGLGSVTLTIKRCGYTSHLFPMASRKVLAAIQPNGTVTKCTVLSATDNGVATGTETLTLDTAAPAGSMISYLLYGRLESDTLEIQWRTNGFADCEMGFIECPAELAPTEFEALTDVENAGAPNPAAGPAVASMTTAVVPAGRQAVPTYFTVTARDANGIRVSAGGATVAAAVTGANTATPTITDLQNGQYRGAYTPANQGTDSVAITYNASAIKNSPYTSVVGATAAVASMPFGFYGDHPFSYGPSRLLAITNRTSSIIGTLTDAAAAGVKVALSFNRGDVKDAAGRFSLSRFQTQCDLFAAVPGLLAFVPNTLTWHDVIDDYTDEHWGGIKPSIATLSAASAYSNAVLGTLSRVRSNATNLRGITDMDIAGCQYVSWRDGHFDSSGASGVTAYRAAQEAAATAIGCRIHFGLNTINGGDGTSGIRGTRVGRWAMSASEITRYGKVLAASAMSDAFPVWAYLPSYASYFNTPAIRTAFEALSTFCSTEFR